MPLHLIRNDITKMKTDAIVNTANPRVTIGSGTDYAIYEAAGKEELLKERQKVGEIAEGDAAFTPAFHLDAKYLIHTVSPVWHDGKHQELEKLSSCYQKSLALAKALDCHSVSFPLLASGANGFPADLALQCALHAIEEFLMQNEMDVYLVVFNNTAFELSKKIFHDVKSYIEENSVQMLKAVEYKGKRRRNNIEYPESLFSMPVMDAAVYEERDVVLPAKEKTFQNRLFELIDQSGETDPVIYKRANLDRKLFAKIRKDENYKPSRKTAISLALALRLSLDDAIDLISRSGYTLSYSSTFDLIIRYCFEHREYDIYEVNSILFRFDQETL